MLARKQKGGPVMKRLAVCALLLCALALAGCSAGGAAADYPAAIMVDDVVYLLPDQPSPAEAAPEAIVGYTFSYTDTFPEQNGETNFNRELEMPYAVTADGLAVLYDNEWYLCTPMESQNQNRHGHRPCRSVCRNTSLDGKPRRVPSSADDGIK